MRKEVEKVVLFEYLFENLTWQRDVHADVRTQYPSQIVFNWIRHGNRRIFAL